MMQECTATTKIKKKIDIVAKYEDTHEFLQFYLDTGPFHVTSNALFKYIDEAKNKSKKLSFTSIHHPNESIKDILDKLQKRTITGHQALHLINEYYDLLESKDNKETFIKILDKNLKIGLGIKGLREALNSSSPNMNFSLSSNIQKNLPVALGYPHDHQIAKIEEKLKKDNWMISRKYDGVRCLARLERRNESDDGEINVHLFTRSGKLIEKFPFLNHQLKALAENIHANDKSSTFYFDGELVMNGKEGCDDFKAVFSEISKKDCCLQESVHYLLFDVFDEAGLGRKRLSERIDILQKALKASAPNANIQMVQQKLTNNPMEDIKKIKWQEEGWEGLILRKDCAHQGKRTTDLIKIKQFHEQEFAVKDYKTEWMQVAHNGKHLQEKVLSSVLVDYGGGVWVGSGFSLEERRAFARDPDLILNSILTIRYFSKSEDCKGKKSLRFPTVKAIYRNKRAM